MKWTHKKIEIEVNENGWFVFTYDKREFKEASLNEARNTIDELLKDYYDFTEKDYKTLLKKLNNRERDFVNSLVKELSCHESNAYCSLGIYNYFEFKVDFDKLMNPF